MKYYLLIGIAFLSCSLFAGKSAWYYNKDKAITRLHAEIVALDEKNSKQVIGMIKLGVPLNEKRNDLTLLQALFRSRADVSLKSEIAGLMLGKEEVLVDGATLLDAVKSLEPSDTIPNRIISKGAPVTKGILKYFYKNNDDRFENWTQGAAPDQRLTWAHKAKLKFKIV